LYAPLLPLLLLLLRPQAKTDASELGLFPVAGYLHVVGVDAAARTLTVLAPSFEKLPGTKLIAGTLKWTDVSS